MRTSLSTPIRGKRRWYQFSLRTLLIVPIIVGFATYWFVQHQKVSKARQTYESIIAVGPGFADEKAMQASKALCKAEEDMPFADVVRARALHVSRLSELMLRAKSRYEIGEAFMGGGEKGQERAYECLLNAQKALLQAQDELSAAQ